MTKKPKMPMHPQRRKFLEHQANRKIAQQIIKADRAAGLRNTTVDEAKNLEEVQDEVRTSDDDATGTTV